LALNKIFTDEILLAGHQDFKKLANYEIAKKDYTSNLTNIIIKDADYLLIAVQDDKIKTVAKELSQYNISEKYTYHISGSRDASELAELNQRGAFTACLHPLQTFPRLFCAPETFAGIFWSFQGDEACYSFANDITSRLHGHLIKLSADQKRALHIAGIFAANYLVGLLSVAESVLKDTGFDKTAFNKILQPLLQGVTTNYKNASAKDILSGPLKRGDLEVIRKHLDYLKETNGPIELYKELANVILENEDFRIVNREQLVQLIDLKTD
jgi:predicted short-subunit dehydrogenase-like oxidoreductase (DUF2520 family)